jgi:hypothetical protein
VLVSSVGESVGEAEADGDTVAEDFDEGWSGLPPQPASATTVATVAITPSAAGIRLISGPPSFRRSILSRRTSTHPIISDMSR